MLARMFKLVKWPSLGPASRVIPPSRPLISMAGCHGDSCPIIRTTGNGSAPTGCVIPVGNVTHATQSSGAAAVRGFSYPLCR